MKKVKADELRAEYYREDLGKGVRGKHYESYQKGTNLVLIRPDVALAFPTEEAVNDALRSLIELARKSIGLSKRSSAILHKKI
ncbi:hypothetical protein HY745_09455 [Candidatus Desantisbacteria bacterium]|nr:hypothetical protein [Candidatus Desantisbacteria bacterium]